MGAMGPAWRDPRKYLGRKTPKARVCLKIWATHRSYKEYSTVRSMGNAGGRVPPSPAFIGEEGEVDEPATDLDSAHRWHGVKGDHCPRGKIGGQNQQKKKRRGYLTERNLSGHHREATGCRFNERAGGSSWTAGRRRKKIPAQERGVQRNGNLFHLVWHEEGGRGGTICRLLLHWGRTSRRSPIKGEKSTSGDYLSKKTVPFSKECSAGGASQPV